MKKRLIFYFYVTPDFFEQKSNLIHLECLKKYANVFDNADFYLSLDNVNDYELIKNVEKTILELPFKGNISFNIHQNDRYRESAIVKEEIADKVKYIDDIVFFGHGKGITNYSKYDEISMNHWTIGCYYLSLNFIDEMEYYINNNDRTFCCYGSFPLVDKDMDSKIDNLTGENGYVGRIKYHWYYSGTFFWVNMKSVNELIRMFDIEMPKLIDRYYSEKLLGNLFPYNGNGVAHNNRYLFSSNNMYNDGIALDCIKFLLKPEEFDDYMNFYYSIINKINVNE